MKDYYKILGVDRTANKNDIQKSFRKLAKQYHPDVNNENTKFDQIFADINEAYETLKDEEKRKGYDKTFNNFTSDANNKMKPKEDYKREFDFNSVNSSFESFFGFDAKTGNITKEEGLKNKNPLSTGDLFEKFMGFKK